MNRGTKEAYLVVAGPVRSGGGIARSRVQADVTCRRCEYRICTPTCPVDGSMNDSVNDPADSQSARDHNDGMW